MDLNGRVAIVTGGGTGIGRAVCLRLAKAGAKAVVVNYSRSDKDARATAAELIVIGPDAMAHQADVSNEDEVKAMIAAVKDRYGRLDVLINNAGTTRFIAHPDLDALTDEVWDDMLEGEPEGHLLLLPRGCAGASKDDVARSSTSHRSPATALQAHRSCMRFPRRACCS